MSTSADTAPRAGLFGTRTEGLALLVVTATIWGCTWPQNKYLLSLLPPFTARGIPNLLGAAFAFAVALGSRAKLRPPRGEWRWLLIYGALNYGAFTIFTTLSLEWLTASQAVVITYTLPIWASLLAWPMLGERPGLRGVLAIILALGGVALLVGGGSAHSAVAKLPGVLFGFTAAVLFGLGTVVAKKRPLAMHSAAGVAWQALFGALLVAALALFEHPDWRRLTMTGIAIFAWIAVMPLTVAYLAWFRALRYVPASLASTTVLLSPAIGVIASALLLGDVLGPRQLAALTLTLTGVAMAAIK